MQRGNVTKVIQSKFCVQKDLAVAFDHHVMLQGGKKDSIHRYFQSSISKSSE